MKKQPEFLLLTIEDVKTKREIKKEITQAVAAVYTDQNKINCFVNLGGVNTIEALEVALGLYHLYEQILETLKKETSSEFVEKMLKEIAQDIEKHEGPKNEKEN